jgi:hypothetical protein
MTFNIGTLNGIGQNTGGNPVFNFAGSSSNSTDPALMGKLQAAGLPITRASELAALFSLAFVLKHDVDDLGLADENERNIVQLMQVLNHNFRLQI